VLAERYFAAGHDDEDLVQIALAAANKALDNWRPTGGRTLKSYAWMAMERDIQDVVAASRRLKRGDGTVPLSLEQPIDANGTDTVGDMIAAHGHDPYGAAAARDLLEQLVGRCSTLERQVLPYLISAGDQGSIYALAAERLGVTEKAVDNAMQRIRRKAAKLEAA
jgi:RNA polymerase sporulation-specific sigma factor